MLELTRPTFTEKILFFLKEGKISLTVEKSVVAMALVISQVYCKLGLNKYFLLQINNHFEHESVTFSYILIYFSGVIRMLIVICKIKEHLTELKYCEIKLNKL